MPRRCSSSPWRHSASWLLADPHTTDAFNTASDSSLMVAPSAQGQYTSTSAATDVGRGDLGGPVGPDHRADLRRVDVADQHGGALADEELDHRNADRTETLHDDTFAAQRRRAGLMLDACAHRLQHAERRRRADRSGTAGGLGQGDDVARLDAHVVHVLQGRADVLARQVLAAQASR